MFGASRKSVLETMLRRWSCLFYGFQLEKIGTPISGGVIFSRTPVTLPLPPQLNPRPSP